MSCSRLLRDRSRSRTGWLFPLALTRVPPGVDAAYQDYPLLGPFLNTTVDHPADPRNADKEGVALSEDDPLTLGLHNGRYIILDGLHRAKTFLVSASPDTIPVYVPVRSATR